MQKSRSEIEKKYTWSVEDIYADDMCWEKDWKVFEEILPELSAYQGKLGEDALELKNYMEKKLQAEFLLGKLYLYASMKNHEDTRIPSYQELNAKAENCFQNYMEAVSFEQPEILGLSKETMEAFYEKEPQLKDYQVYFERIFREKEHTLSKESEQILAASSDMARSPREIYQMFLNADLSFDEVEDGKGEKTRLTHGNYIALLQSDDRTLRKNAFETLYHTYENWENTIAAMYRGHLKQDVFYSKLRNYKNSRQMYLADGNVPEKVYDNLIETVHKKLPAMYRYVKLRKKMLQVEKLHMYDLYVPVVKVPEKKYDIETAKELVKKALAPLGENYLSILEEGYENRWMDVYENKGKYTGAYSNSAYGVHPFVLLNYQEDLESVFTLAHEMGHAIHSYLSNKKQPQVYADYLIFVAEVASTCNEQLVQHYLMEHASTVEEKKYLLNKQLENIRGTLIRQTMFAEFEKITHELAEKGEVLTAERLKSIYRDLNILYFGEDIVVDHEIDMEWARIPHFYRSFYVYQYATGISAACSFAKQILEKGPEMVKNYIDKFLSAGCSKDPIEILRDAGVDMGSETPIEDALQLFEDAVDELEKLCD